MKTYGYGYAFALDGGAVNQILQRNLASVDQTSSYTTVDSQTGTTINLQATIAPWSILPGGQNTLLDLNLRFSEGSLTTQAAQRRTERPPCAMLSCSGTSTSATARSRTGSSDPPASRARQLLWAGSGKRSRGARDAHALPCRAGDR